MYGVSPGDYLTKTVKRCSSRQWQKRGGAGQIRHREALSMPCINAPGLTVYHLESVPEK